MSRREAEVFLMSLLQMNAVWFLISALTMPVSSQIIHCKIRIRRPAVRLVEVSFRKVKNIDITTFEQALRRSTMFTNPAITADSFADELADVVSAELDQVAALKTCLRQQSKPSTKCGSSRRLLTLNASVRAWKVSGSDTVVS